MQIDWVTVVAQIVNFLVLVYLLKRFLYRPVIEAMARREQRIADRLQEAEHREQQAEKAEQEYRNQTEALEQRRQQLMREAEQAAGEKRKELLDQAREEVDQARAEWRQEVTREQDEFLNHLRQRIGEAVSQTARRALTDLADAELEEQVIRTFLTRLERLSDEDVKSLSEARAPVVVATGFDAGADLRTRIQEAMNERVGNIELSFERASDLIAGIELRTKGRKIGWTVHEYLDTLESNIRDELATHRAGEE